MGLMDILGSLGNLGDLEKQVHAGLEKLGVGGNITEKLQNLESMLTTEEGRKQALAMLKGVVGEKVNADNLMEHVQTLKDKFIK